MIEPSVALFVTTAGCADCALDLRPIRPDPDSHRGTPAAESFEAFAGYMRGITDPDERAQFMHASREVCLMSLKVERLYASGKLPVPEETLWLIMQQYDVDRDLEDLIDHNKVEKLPVVGLALCLTLHESPLEGDVPGFVDASSAPRHTRMQWLTTAFVDRRSLLLSSYR